jgi:hypothetical protein
MADLALPAAISAACADDDDTKIVAVISANKKSFIMCPPWENLINQILNLCNGFYRNLNH